MSGLILYLGSYPNFVRRIIIFFLYHCTLLFGVNFVELRHSSISNKVKRPYWKIMYSFMSPMKMIRCWTQQILFCCAILALQFFWFFFFFGTNKRYNSALHKTIKLCFYLSVVLFYFIFSLASRFVFISSYFCSLNDSLIWCEASLLNIQQNKKNKPTISLNLIFHSFQCVQFSILLFC